MKTKIYTHAVTLLLSFSSIFTIQAGTTYNITSNSNWSAVLPSTCLDCTIKISNNVTLTINGSMTCQNCTFQGGTLAMTNQTLNLQYAGTQTTTVFKNTDFLVYGNSSKVIVNAPLSVTNSTFTFNNGSYFNTSYDVTLSNSTVNLYDNSSMYSTGGSSTLISLESSSQIVVGNGSLSSSSVLSVSGPTLKVNDHSSVALGNENNVYNNWSNYVYSPNANANSHASTSYSTNNNTLNCGNGHAHSCTNPSVYGPSALSSAGAVSSTPLPVVLAAFMATLNNDKTVDLKWNTQQEINAGHFEIERSADGNAWSTIGSIAAKGNSNTVSAYSFTDNTPMAGVNYYRLRMVDLDGKYAYTEVKVIRTSVINNISFFPNPARDFVNVSVGQNSRTSLTIRLVSLSGQVLQEKNVPAGSAGTTVSFSIQQVPAGMYILSVAGTDGTMESSKLMVSKS